MLLAVSIGVIFTGTAVFIAGYKQWSFQELMLGHWGVPAGSSKIGAATPTTGNPNLNPTSAGAPPGGNPNTQPYSPTGVFTQA